LQIPMQDEHVDTLGGWYFIRDSELRLNHFVEYEGYEFRIKQKQGLVLQYIEIKKIDEAISDAV